MVQSYSKNANHNMRRPVVKEEIVQYMRQHQKQNTGCLAELEAFAKQENIPIIPHETATYFRFLMQTLQPKHILEIGTAIGFSALLMAENAPEAKITTIDRNEEMIALAKENFAKYDNHNQITLLEGDAVDVLQTLDKSYDFVFMDSAKSKY
ncbi:O-methyltransferase, partial [Streptococcus agalactiae]|nr:O-methyltransferase [Streptococcus agalactiae]MCK6369099.1 O-methyltransferase [Streptococcus agalactiae]